MGRSSKNVDFMSRCQKNPKTKYIFENSLVSKGKHCCFYVGIQFSTQNCTFESIENSCFDNLKEKKIAWYIFQKKFRRSAERILEIVILESLFNRYLIRLSQN